MAIRFDDQMTPHLEMMQSKVNTAVLMYATTKASTITADMQKYRPWTDRTGMAKATLSTKASRLSDTAVRLTLAHGVYYGIYLELSGEKNYAIIKPTIDKFTPRLVEDLNGFFSRLK